MRIKQTVQLFIISLVSGYNLSLLQAQTYGCQAGKNSQAQPPIYYCAENLRSDTFNVLKYTINLEIGNTSNKLISGNTQIRVAPKINNRTYVRFDLLELIVDSVKENNTLLTYTYNDTILKINFASPKNTTDTSILTVYYRGIPQVDATGWGGFYFDNTQSAQYAYNLGVGFGAKPHNYGRVWFPCFDNFVERSKYEFNITSDSARRAYCNGQLVSDIVNGANRTRSWVLNDEVPSYLVNVSLAKYKQVNWTVNTLNGVKPITLAAFASDTNALKAGFVNLKSCINGFENYFGPYKWNRFGYSLIPFSGGAMEHVTNISYPRQLVGIAYEASLMAHELSHHWWGDLITCETQEDMWINEGMATFSSYMFTEWQYGKTAYLNAVKNEHENLLHFLHKTEGFRPISGVPHSLTYGDHVYKKGADVAHTLRGYMGDNAFFNATKYVMQQKELQSVNSIEFRDLLQTSSGQNLTDFFNNWIFAGGWSHFAIDSVRFTQISPSSVDAVISLKQKLYGAPSLHNNVPLEVAFFKNDWSKEVRQVVMSGATKSFTVNIPFNPVYYALNYDSKISDATSHDIKIIKNPGNNIYNLGKLFVQVLSSGADSSLLRVVHNYVKPDPFKYNPVQHKLSDQHFWRVEGILSPGFSAKAKFNYDGNKSVGGTYSYLDTLLTTVNGDSICLFYRQNASDDWKLVNNIFKFKSSAKTGYIEIDSLKLGEYTFGNYGDSSLLVIKKQEVNEVSVKVYPNPAKHKCTVEFKEIPKTEYMLSLIDIEGKIVLSQIVYSKVTSFEVGQFSKGSYLIKVEKGNKLVATQKLILE
jgi:hypothetical protein